MSEDLIKRSDVEETLQNIFSHHAIAYGGKSGGFSQAIAEAITNIPTAERTEEPPEKEELLNCPFCGKPPQIIKTIRIAEKDRGMTPTHDLEVGWEIKCSNCGTSKKAYGFTYYKLTNEGNLEIVPQNYTDKEEASPADKRKEVILMWNKRFNYHTNTNRRKEQSQNGHEQQPNLRG